MLKNIIILATCLLLLQSCIVETAFVAGAATGASIINDKRSMRTIIEDKNMSHQLNNKIEGDDELYQQCHIVISTYNHIVLLTGQAPTDELRKQALTTVKTQDKVKRIYNEIQIAAPSSALTRSSDAWITTKIRTKMLLAKSLRSGQIKVVTENGTAYLLGLVDKQQADIAAEAARKVPGVQRVVKLFEYLSVVS